MSDDPLRVLGERQREADAVPDDSPMSTDLEHLLQPFDGDERASLLDGVFSRLDSGELSPQDELDVEAAPADAPVAAPIDLAAARKRRRSTWIGVAVAVAAALLLWVGLGRGPSGPAGSGLPTYAITTLEGGPKAMRSADDGVPERLELSANDRIEWVFTPASPTRAKVAVAVLAVPQQGGAPVFAALTGAQVAPSGAVRIAGRLGEFVPLSPGTWHLTVLIGAQDALPQSADEAAQTGPWERVGLDLVVSPPSP